MTTSNSESRNELRHVAIIMDGNGRWAKAQGLQRSAGHIKGVDTVRTITAEASRLGLEFLTLYAFSTENWNRPPEEVDALMKLIATAIQNETPELIRNNVRLKMIGDISRMPSDAIKSLNESIEQTKNSTGLTLVLALSYSSRWEITRAAALIAQKAAKGCLDPDKITDRTIADHLETAGWPDPDLLIRTGGDFRLSNFLLWQAAYSEIFVTEKYWPDFTADDFRSAIKSFGNRERRFGLTGDQIKK